MLFESQLIVTRVCDHILSMQKYLNTSQYFKLATHA